MVASNPGRVPGWEREPVADRAPSETRDRNGTPPPPFPLSAVDSDALKVVRRLTSAGYQAYLVGGCVRDLCLGRRPKDFDVATSATPEQIRRLFRNSRIIGRRFKLAHVYFGPKVVETSTFRAAPVEPTGDDLLITHDHEWGSIEDVARRRDFTINALFFDVDSQDVVDFVDGRQDLDRHIIRTIGEPAVRFREDPVRMIRAIKFAARLGFSIESATWDALLEVAGDIVRCSQARLLEEIYKVLRCGAAKESFELMVRSGLGQHVMPSYLALYDGLEPADPSTPPRPAGQEPSATDLLWRYLDAIDDYHAQTSQVASNGVLQAALFAPLLGQRMRQGNRQELDRMIDAMMTPIGTALGVARRDRELARQILMAQHRMMGPGAGRRRRASLVNRQYFHDALIFFGVAVRAHGGDGSELQDWRELADRSRPLEPAAAGAGPPKANRRRRGGRRRRGSGSGSRS